MDHCSERDITFIDGLHEELKQSMVKQSNQTRIRRIISEEEYDTDSLREDINSYIEDNKSNISQLINDQCTVRKIVEYIKDQKSM